MHLAIDPDPERELAPSEIRTRAEWEAYESRREARFLAAHAETIARPRTGPLPSNVATIISRIAGMVVIPQPGAAGWP